jgi:hypothetical protein
MAYKVQTYEEMEREIDIYCMLFGVTFCIVYIAVVCTIIYVGV